MFIHVKLNEFPTFFWKITTITMVCSYPRQTIILHTQTIRSAMSTRLSNSDSAGLQCYNSNLINILQLSKAEHMRSLAVVQQLNQIAGPSLLRRYLPSLINKVAIGGSITAFLFNCALPQHYTLPISYISTYLPFIRLLY